MTLLKIGTPFSLKGYTSALYPLSEYWLAPRIDIYLVKISWTIDFPEPVCPKPRSFVLPKSLSKAAMCLSISFKCLYRYWAAPSLSLPDYYPLQAINLKVLLGLKFNFLSILNASKTVINPPPSSLAPVCDPVSHVSIWPPAKTT